MTMTDEPQVEAHLPDDDAPAEDHALVREIYGVELLDEVADVSAELRLLAPFLRAFLGRAHGAVLACRAAEDRWEASGRELPEVAKNDTHGALSGVQELAELAGDAGVYDCVIEGGSSNHDGIPPVLSLLEAPDGLPVVLVDGILSDEDRRRNLAMGRRFEELQPFIAALLAEARLCFARFEVLVDEHEGPSISRNVSDENPVWTVLRHLTGMDRLYDAVDDCGLNDIYDGLVIDLARKVVAEAGCGS